MALTLQDRFSRIVDAKLRASLVQRDGFVWNTKYEGDPKAGAVKVPVRDEATVVSYDKANGAAKSYTAGSFITIAIDKDKAVNEILDGYDAAAVPDNIVADRLDAAGYGLALAMNADGTAKFSDMYNSSICEVTDRTLKKYILMFPDDYLLENGTVKKLR